MDEAHYNQLKEILETMDIPLLRDYILIPTKRRKLTLAKLAVPW